MLTGVTIALYYWGFWYLSYVVMLALLVLLCIESTETISLSRAENRQIIGAKCLVIREATLDSRGIVKLFDSNGDLDGELWSTEFSNTLASEGSIVQVVAIKSIVLQIENVT